MLSYLGPIKIKIYKYSSLLSFMLKLLMSIISGFFFASSCLGEYQYRLIEKDKHKIHLIIIDPKEYEASIVSARDGVFGREKIGDIAKRVDASIAINAGFFEIGGNKDGKKVGTIVNDGKLFGLRVSRHDCLVKDGDRFFVDIIEPSLEVKIDERIIKPKKLNQFATGQNIYYFNDRWGSNTLSASKERAEVIIDGNLKIIGIARHGGNKIPPDGHILSFPIDDDLTGIKVGQEVKLTWRPDYLMHSGNLVLMGVPTLIKNNVINDKISKYTDIHARTAVGIRGDGKLLLTVAEHHYTKPILEANLGDIKDIFTNKKISYNNLQVSDMKKLLLENLNSKSDIIGLTLPELAKFMQENECVEAINLDGGGSSSLYIDGKYVNASYGDDDESLGQKTVRPVSDALVFKEKK